MKSEFIKPEKIKTVDFNDLPKGKLAEIVEHLCPEYIGVVVMKNYVNDVIIIHRDKHIDNIALSGWDNTEHNIKSVFPDCKVRILGPDEYVILKND